MNEIREKFLRLASWLNRTGLVDALNRTKSVEELKELWNRFIQTSRQLITETNEWKRKFYYRKDKLLIFEPFEEIPYPTEIACLIKIMDLDEEEIFWDRCDLQNALKKERKPFSTKVAKLMNDKSIRCIATEDIFSE